MLILSSGKGGSGKTTIAALLADHVQGTVLALDSDINQGLADQFHNGRQPKSLMDEMDGLMPAMYAGNPHVIDASAVPKSIPPAPHSPLYDGISPERNPLVAAAYAVQDNGVISMRTGALSAEDQLSHCNHYNIGAGYRMLLHTVIRPDEMVIADTMAGNDNPTGGLPSIADGAVIVVEPTEESIKTAKDIIAAYTEIGVPNIAVAANRVEDEGDLNFIRKKIGLEPVCAIPYAKAYFRARGEGESPELPQEIAAELQKLQAEIAAWQPESSEQKYLRAVAFHNSNNPNHKIPAELARAHAVSYATRVNQLRDSAEQQASAPRAAKGHRGPRVDPTRGTHPKQIAQSRDGTSRER